jgi:hypothetical protein
MRDHKPFVIDKFRGLWARQDYGSCPPDHFTECNNIDFRQDAVATRDGIAVFPFAIQDVVRMYPFNQESGHSLICLDSSGRIYDSEFPSTPILTLPTMTDFGFVSMLGRAYISPCNGKTGLPGTQVYVYEGDGTPARVAAGLGPIDLHGIMTAVNSTQDGSIEAGTHLFAAVYETKSGFLTNYGPDHLQGTKIDAPGGKKADLANIPVSPNPAVVKVHIVATKAITGYNGDPSQYEYFFVPGAVFTNGTTTGRVTFFDADLLDSADDLQDLFTTIPAGVGLGIYHNRLLVYATANDISAVWVSNPGEPEAINQVDGLLVFPLDGDPITNAQEFRDVLYVFKQSRTNAWSDNGDVPSSWPITILDQGIGCSVHGLATVLDSGGVNIDFLIICDLGGIYLFNGAYVKPELTWKLRDLWLNLNRPEFRTIRIVNNTVAKRIHVLLPNNIGTLLGDYRDALTPKDILWSRWTYNLDVRDLAFFKPNTPDAEFDTLFLGAYGSSGGVYQRVNGRRTDQHREPPMVLTEDNIPDPRVAHFQFGEDQSEAYLHIGAVTLGITGTGMLRCDFLDLQDNPNYQIFVIMRPDPVRLPRILCNAQGQRLRFTYKTTGKGEVFILDRIILWYKPLWTEHPGDSADLPVVNPLPADFKWPQPHGRS